MSDSANLPDDLDARRGLTERLLASASAPQLLRWGESKEASRDAWLPAYELTVAMGHCQLFGFNPENSSLVAPIYASMVEAALRGSFHRTNLTLDALRDLDSNLDSSESPLEDHEITIGILESRFDLEACSLACKSTLSAYRSASIAYRPVLDALIKAQERVLGKIDESIWEQRSLLAIADETFWIVNLRGDLPDDVWQPRPWWLCDDIEEFRNFRKVLIRGMESASEQTVLQVFSSPRAEVRSKEDDHQPLPADLLGMAADAQAELPPESLMRFEFIEGQVGEHQAERICVSFELQQGQQGLPTDTLPNEARVTISVEAVVPVADSEIDENGFAVRTYVVRWGVHSHRIQMRRKVFPGTIDIAIQGTAETSWGDIQLLYQAEKKSLFLRRLR